MRISTIIIGIQFCCTSLLMATGTRAQEVNLNVTKASVKQVFKRIEQQAKVTFVYDEQVINTLPALTLHIKNEQLPDVINQLQTKTQLQFKMVGNYIGVAQSDADMPQIAQTQTTEASAAKIGGTVKDIANQPLVGVTVTIKGTQKGASTDINGSFSIDANIGDILVFNYIGYARKELAVTGAALNVVLTEDSKQLGEVVVTALGIKKSEKSVTYSTQQVSGSELTRVKSDNLMNSLNGKVAGVTISPSASGVGGSAKVILRGNKSAAGNNQPLYVIDGIPISNGSNANGQPNSTYGTNVGQGGGAAGTSTNQDGGDGISNLNPEDIESISVLKGASAAALYGSQAQNGVILITTKKGKAGKTQINFSSGYTINKIAYKPEFQNSYGQSAPGATYSWGAPISGGGHDNLSDFYQTGNNWTNSINLSGGNEIAQTYFSYANTDARGVEPNNKLVRNNFNLRETAKFLNNKLTVDGNVNYIDQKINNAPGLGLYLNPLTGLYLFPRGQDILPYKNNYSLPPAAGGNGAPTQNWPFNEDVQQNPWWTINNDPSIAQRNRILINGSVKYDFTSWLSLQVRGNLDRTTDRYEQDLDAGTNPVYAKSNGQFLLSNQTTEQKYGDALLTFTVPMKSDFKIDGVLGASITDAMTTGNVIGPDVTNSYSGTGLLVPNVFLPENLITAQNGPPVTTLLANHNQIQSLFANANFSYKNWAYLTLTGRNDWSSNLAYTPNESYFYPSAGLSFILNQMFNLPKTITYAKIRGTYAQVGNTVPPYVTNPLTHFNIGGGVILNSVAPFPELKPERTKSFELGTDLRFLDDRLSASFTYYKSNTINQFIKVIPSYVTTYSQGYVNAGNIENSGIEFMLGYDVIKSKDLTWNTSFNGSTFHNKVLDVDSKDGINQFILTPNLNNTYESVLAKGGSFGDIYGVTLQRDAQGRVLIGADGTPQINSNFTKIGNPNPKFQLGWSNSFNYQKFSFSFLVDGKFGGQVLSLTQAMMDKYGVSKVTGDARAAGGVSVNGVSPSGQAVSSVDPQKWYNTIGGRDGVSGEYVYSATVVRLREAAFGYTFPIKNSVFKSLKLAVTGRNLIYFYKKAPYDPEVTMSTGNGLSGVDVFNQPATRNFGLNLNVAL